MQLDPIAREDALAWLDRADMDLRAARADLAADPPLRGDAAFHCQQAIEKSLKAVLALHDEPFKKTHDLEPLAIACANVEPTLKGLAPRVGRLSRYAWEFRYPGDAVEPSREETLEALSTAEDVVRQVRRLLLQ